MVQMIELNCPAILKIYFIEVQLIYSVYWLLLYSRATRLHMYVQSFSHSFPLCFITGQ